MRALAGLLRSSERIGDVSPRVGQNERRPSF
jgi:hypothetical protein